MLLEHGRRLDNFELRSELLSEPIGRGRNAGRPCGRAPAGPAVLS